MIRAGINGFGRIGRTALRVWLDRSELQKEMEIVAINTSGSVGIEGWARLLKYDTAYGPLKLGLKWQESRKPDEVTEDNPEIGSMTIGELTIPVLAQRDPSKIPWSNYEVDVVLECTGIFRTEDQARQHLHGGARKVLLSAPDKGGDVQMILVGVNRYDGRHTVTSNASCTTNCVAPIMKVLTEEFGVLKAGMSTVHGYTDNQNLQDGSHKDPYRGRAAAANIVPTTTGAAQATGNVLPQIKGVFDGMAVRPPIITGSIADVTALVKRKTSIDEVNDLYRKAAQNEELRGILAVTDEPLVSSDIIGRPESAIVALPFTNVIDGDLVKVLAWYDNEWGFSNRLVEAAVQIGAGI
ncbi:MAG: type I glyceraldehyde-3-phosphate dehydrogenase [Desulfovermiculus sp.]|nr:type I glyceraldehyde-3-phosphate dehydrogenase [Desulfovermiculus sp.]